MVPSINVTGWDNKLAKRNSCRVAQFLTVLQGGEPPDPTCSGLALIQVHDVATWGSLLCAAVPEKGMLVMQKHES